jgi:hypothetical protein
MNAENPAFVEKAGFFILNWGNFSKIAPVFDREGSKSGGGAGPFQLSWTGSPRG